MKEAVTILNQALLTEKATMLSANLNKYSFVVSSSASRRDSGGCRSPVSAVILRFPERR